MTEAEERAQRISRLLAAWTAYRRAMGAIIAGSARDPDDGVVRDAVQAMGMAFALEWGRTEPLLAGIAADGGLASESADLPARIAMPRAVPDLLRILADDALPRDDDEWGSDRQIDAENRFFEHCRAVDPSLEEDGSFEIWCLKATTAEMVGEALRRMGIARTHPSPPVDADTKRTPA